MGHDLPFERHCNIALVRLYCLWYPWLLVHSFLPTENPNSQTSTVHRAFRSVPSVTLEFIITLKCAHLQMAAPVISSHCSKFKQHSISVHNHCLRQIIKSGGRRSIPESPHCVHNRPSYCSVVLISRHTTVKIPDFFQDIWCPYSDLWSAQMFSV